MSFIDSVLISLEMCFGGSGSLVCVSFSLFLQFVLPLVLRPEQTVHISLLVLTLYVYQVYMIDITTVMEWR